MKKRQEPLPKAGGMTDAASAHLTRREAIQVLGGSALMSALLVSGCRADPFGQEGGQYLELEAPGQGQTNAPLPLILFVPGFTLPIGVVNSVTKASYFASQRNNLANVAPTRAVRYMNDEGDYDSHRRSIKGNANAIARVLREESNRTPRRPVTIVSHSKGGQDVLHALVQLNNETELPYNGGTETPGKPVNRDLWHNVTGWVALTSNHFESEFQIESDEGGGLPHTCILPNPNTDCAQPSNICPPDDCGSAYADFPVEAGNERQQYMRDHRCAIEQLMQSVPTVSAYATYIPTGPAGRNSGALNLFNRGIRVLSRAAGKCGANDGLVPARAAQLPGAMIRKLDTDPKAKKLVFFLLPRPRFVLVPKCGVDHLAPAVKVTLPGNRFWTRDFRNTQTRRYIAEVESESRLPFAVFDIEEAEAELEEDGDEFEVEGRFVAASAIDVLNEDVTVTFGCFSETIPAGSFFRDDDEEGFQFDGAPGGIRRAEIRDDGEFEVKGRGMDLSEIDFASPVPFSLRIGNDLGISEIPFKVEDEGKFEFEADADDDDD